MKAVKRGGQQTIEHLFLFAAVLAVIALFAGPVGIFRPAVNRIIQTPSQEIQKENFNVCLGPACAAACGDLVCDSAKGESCVNCDVDCGRCPAFCGDGICNAGETTATCNVDCISP